MLLLGGSTLALRPPTPPTWSSLRFSAASSSATRSLAASPAWEVARARASSATKRSSAATRLACAQGEVGEAQEGREALMRHGACLKGMGGHTLAGLADLRPGSRIKAGAVHG